MFKATVSAQKFAAVARCVSSEETRYYLHGIHLSAPENGEPGVCMVATDGHRLMYAYDPHGAIEGGPALVKPPKAKMPAAWIKAGTIELRDNMAFATTPRGEPLAAPAPVMDAHHTFPDWARVVPDEFSGEVAQFNADYLADFKAIGQILGETPFVLHNGDNPAFIGFNADAFGVLMPMRGGLSDDAGAAKAAKARQVPKYDFGQEAAE